MAGAGIEVGAASAAVVLLSEDGEDRVTLQGELATFGRLDAVSGVFEDWRSGKFKEGENGVLEITYVSKKKGGTVEYTIVPDFNNGRFSGDVSFEE